MAITLENASLQLTINPAFSTWSVRSRHPDGPFIENARFLLRYRSGPRWRRSLYRWPALSVGDVQAVESPHGRLHQRRLTIGPDRKGLHFTILFAIPDSHPLLFWKLRVDHQGDKAGEVGRIDLLRVGFRTILQESIRLLVELMLGKNKLIITGSDGKMEGSGADA